MAALDPTYNHRTINPDVAVFMRQIFPTLTQREATCFFWACLNLPKKEIAGRMGISENTVRSHIKTGFEKQGIENMRNVKTTFLAHLILLAFPTR